MANFIQKFYKNNFVYGTKEKLSKLTILFVIILNIIVFNIILEGLSFQTSFVNSPSSVYTYLCTNIVKNDDLIKLENFSNFTNEDYKENYRDNIKLDESKKDLRCLEVEKRVALIKEEHNLKELNKNIKKLNQNIFELEDTLTYYRSNYNTVLFEKIANQENEKSLTINGVDAENIKEKYNEALEKVNKIKEQKELINSTFGNSKSVEDLRNYISKIKDEYIEDEKSAFKKYYYFIEIVKILFLLPLVFSFFYLVKKYLKDEKYILYIIFKNLFFVTLIPTLYTLFEIIYKFLPKVFLSKVIEFFYNLDIPFVVYYFLVIVFVVIFAIIIIKIQKRFKEQNELMKKNKISKIDSFNQNLCNSCGNRVSYLMMNFCPICQNKLTTRCNSCQKDTILGFNFCQSCGTSMENK